MSEHTGKNIILCSDGTGNSGGKGRGTNVWRMFLSIDQHVRERPQLAFYDDGVGTSSIKIKQLIGGAMGVGLGRNIRQLYTSLCKNYEDGDRIYLFGFSRGAFTVRSLAGMISTIGVLPGGSLDNEELDREVERAYWAYRSRRNRHREELTQRYAVGKPLKKPRVHFIGVWDTVNAIGVPMEWLRTLVQKVAFMRRPHSHGLRNDATGEPNRVDYVYHALAIDEERLAFKPEMYDESLAEKAGVKEIVQVWFSGVHSNVGGGYPKPGMANVTLAWMMGKASERGLEFVEGAQKQANDATNVHSKLYDSRSGVAAYYRYKVRDVGEYSTKYCQGKCKVHVSAIERIERGTKYYAPTNFPLEFEVLRGAAFKEDSPADIGREDEQDRIHRYNDLIHDHDHQTIRKEAKAPAEKAKKQRERLYWAFLLVTIALLIVLGIQEMSPSPDGWFANIEKFSASLRPPFLDAGVVGGVFSAIGGAFSWLVEGLLPEFLSDPVVALVRVPELLVIAAVVGWVLFRSRRTLIRRMRNIGVNMWREVLS